MQYKGMRWFKCDFQVQTPEFSSDWLDADFKLKDPRRPVADGKPDESDIQEKARIFLQRCHELELEVIGVTDHNFSGKRDARDWFLTHLLEQNKAVASTLGRAPLYIFPGFEVDIGYHVLCLFEPGKAAKLPEVSETLTTLGLSVDNRYKQGKPAPLRYEDSYVPLRTLLKVVQEDCGGMVIAAHAFSKDGICDDAKHIDDYRNDQLLCVEVSDFPLAGKARDVLSGTNRDWSRSRRQPAAVMSSDAKSLKAGSDGNPRQNSLGYRYTWVKMSSPSIESLRQAFLDPDSRISLPTQEDRRNPDSRLGYPRLRAVSLSGLGFLEDQAVQLSPNLSCIIGGRGTGKSTLLECIRFALHQPSANADIARKASRIRKTFSNKTEVRISWEASPGLVDEIIYQPHSDEWRWDGKTEEQTRTFLRQIPVQVFSQGELTEIASDEGSQGNRLLPLVDAMHATELGELISAEAILRGEVMKLYAAHDQRAQINADLGRAELELQELDRQWHARKEVQSEAEAHRIAQAAEQYLRDIEEAVDSDIQSITSALETDASTPEELLPLPGVLENHGSSAWYKSVRESVLNWKENLRVQLEALLAASRDAADEITVGNKAWKDKIGALKNDQARFFEVCEEKGLQPHDVSRLQELDRIRQTKARDIEDRKRRLSASVAEVKALENKPNELSGNWLAQFRLRKTSIHSLNTLTAPNVEASVRYMGDEAHFVRLWAKLAPDGRTKLGRVWDELGSAIFLSNLARQDDVAIWDWIRDWASKGQSSPGMDKYDDLREDIIDLVTGAKRTEWREIRNTRIADFVDLTLYRSGGQRIGSISGGELSEGQRNTAVLTMLLAQGTGPMVIDQPEDEVDSNFLYEHLVPLLRNAKVQRQLIFVTHNANIPVNADSELIYALESISGKGKVRVQGGLDMKPVTAAVLDIMEGTDEAFRRRSEKYHF